MKNENFPFRIMLPLKKKQGSSENKMSTPSHIIEARLSEFCGGFSFFLFFLFLFSLVII